METSIGLTNALGVFIKVVKKRRYLFIYCLQQRDHWHNKFTYSETLSSKLRLATRISSPYSELVQKFYDKTNSQHDDAISPEEVEKIILQAISNDTPEFRYVVGNYAASLLETRNNRPYSEFQKMIMQNIMQ